MGRLAASLSDLKKRLNLRWLDENRPDLEGQKDPRDEDLEQERMQEKYGAESFKPPASAISNAKRGLELRKRWGRGGLSPSEAKSQGIDSGVTRARKIASGKVSQHDVRRMSAFNRHRKNYRPDKKMPDGGPTAGTIAWLLWGGTSGVNWAKKKSAAMNAEAYEVFDAEEDAYDEIRQLGCPICAHELHTVSASAECPYCEVLWHYHEDDGFSYFEAEIFGAETNEAFCSECGCSHEDSENFSAEGAGGTQVFNSCWKCGSGLHLYQITRYPATPSEIAGVGGDPSQASDEGRRRA